MRDPIDRYISYYFHLQRFAAAPAANVMERMLKHEPLWLYAVNPLHFNVINRYLAGLPPENWDFIGRQECFQHDLVHLQTLLGWDSSLFKRPGIAGLRTNRNELHPADQRPVPAYLQRWIRQVNGKDLALVEQIGQLRAQRGWACPQEARL